MDPRVVDPSRHVLQQRANVLGNHLGHKTGPNQASAHCIERREARPRMSGFGRKSGERERETNREILTSVDVERDTNREILTSVDVVLSEEAQDH